MMAERRVMQVALLYGFNIERQAPSDHPLRRIDPFVDLPVYEPSCLKRCGSPVDRSRGDDLDTRWFTIALQTAFILRQY